MRPPFRIAIAALAAFILSGCGQAPDSRPQGGTDTTAIKAADTAAVIAADPAAVASVVAALDSCGRGDSAATRSSVTLRSFGRFTLFLPDSARAFKLEPSTGQLSVSWPRCPEGACRLNVSVHGDSGISLDARVARLVAEQRRIDSVNKDPRTGVMEFDVIDGPPRPFTTAAGRGYAIDESCGDCAATTLKFASDGKIASVSLSADAVPEAGRRMCEMAVIAKTFSWRVPPSRGP